MTSPRSLPKPAVTHDAYQRTIVGLLRALGYPLVLHVRKSIGKGKKWTTATSVIGWPDLFAAGPRGCAAIEVKIHPDKPTPEQLAVLAQLERAGVRCMVAYPEDFDALAEMLRGAA